MAGPAGASSGPNWLMFFKYSGRFGPGEAPAGAWTNGGGLRRGKGVPPFGIPYHSKGPRLSPGAFFIVW